MACRSACISVPGAGKREPAVGVCGTPALTPTSGALEGISFASPDGHERVAKSGPQVVFDPFGVLPPLLGSGAEPLGTIVTVKQAVVEHRGCVLMIANHGQMLQSQ